MERFTAWLRRHKVILSVMLVAIGFTAIMWCRYNAPICINRMTPADWQDTHIQKIGTVTIQKLESHAPYADMQSIDRISGIGPVKMAQIERHFTTWDTARSEAWWPIMIIGTVLFFGGLLFLCAIAIKDREKHRIAQKLERKLNGDIPGDKNVKR